MSDTPSDSEDISATQYRFSGYQLPKIQLDETGDAYVVLNPHPYFHNQPTYWSKPAYQNNQLIGGDIPIQPSGNTYPVSRNPPYDGTGSMLPM